MKFNKSIKSLDEEILSEEALRRFFYQKGEYDYILSQISDFGAIKVDNQ